MIVENWFSRFHPEFRGNCREDPTAAVPRDPLLAPILCCISCFWMLTTWPTPPPQQPEIDHQQDDDKLQQPQNSSETISGARMLIFNEKFFTQPKIRPQAIVGH
ncbi:uncharacterized protein LOC135169256 isoform X3 [Diachasmimorpha longicaudata]|uniref:uncharacterized protein LOC135169256 isoform X3 n=1 Tax=Diachasmimorpha longicaudata TaxID=58733 RepID=UPI0030B91C88